MSWRTRSPPNTSAMTRHGAWGIYPLIPCHMDQYGILLLFVSVFASGGSGGFTYGFTPVNERSLRPNPKLGGGIVAVVGPLSNLVLAALVAIPLRFGNLDPYSGLATFLGLALF